MEKCGGDTSGRVRDTEEDSDVEIVVPSRDGAAETTDASRGGWPGARGSGLGTGTARDGGVGGIERTGTGTKDP